MRFICVYTTELCRWPLAITSNDILIASYVKPDERGNTNTHWAKRTKQREIRQHIPHYNDVIMWPMASQITSLTIAYSTVFSCADQNKHQSSTPLAFVRGIHRGPVNSLHKGKVTRRMFPFDDVIMLGIFCVLSQNIFLFFTIRSTIPGIQLLLT